jgi:uncharacterized protein GlcG (DUF336 family)
MDLTGARVVLAAVEATAEQLGLSLSTAVVDAAGHEVLTARMPGAPWFTPHVCRTKARTSVALGMDSGEVAALAAAYPDLMPVIDEQLAFSLTTLPGGVVVRLGDDVVGAVACSGATPAQDEQCARAGIDAWRAAHPEG